jgi:hypothetical protein
MSHICRPVIESYLHREPGCAFCAIPGDRVIFQTELCFAVADKYPVTSGHMLVIPKQHVAKYFDLGWPELNGIRFLLELLRQQGGSHAVASGQGEGHHPRQTNQRSDWTSVNAVRRLPLGSTSRQANQSAVDRRGVAPNADPLSIPLRLFEWRFVTWSTGRIANRKGRWICQFGSGRGRVMARVEIDP